MVEFKWIWQFLKKYKFIFLSGMTLVIASTVLHLVNPYVLGQIVDKVIIGQDTNLFLKLAIIMAGATIIRTIFRYTYGYIFEYVSQNVVYNIRERTYVKVQQLDFDFFDRTKTGEIMSRMTGDLEAVRYFTAFVIYSIFLNFFIFISVLTLLFTINPVLMLALLCVAPFIGILAYKLASTVKPAFSAIREQFSRLNSVVQENISGNRVIKAFTREAYEIEKFSRENEGFKAKNLEAANIWQKYLPILDVLAGSLTVLVIIIGGIMTINKSMTLGELITFNAYISHLSNPMKMAGWLINDTQRFAASAEKIMTLLNREPKIKNKENTIYKKRLMGMVEFRNVSFIYKDEKVLRGVSFKAKPGQTIAVVGPTGSGKSTLVNLISRFYDCSEGEILIDGVDIRNYDIGKLRENVAVAMQDIFLFSDTIEGNIAYGVPEIPMDKVEWAAEIAGAHDFISSFTEGYDTIVGERGVGLSGGQKQRIALARALIKDPSILILDDTTSSVDIETEHEIHTTMKSFYRDKTTFIIAHRISTVKNADIILVLENGKITERGTHEELLAKKGYYHSVFISQYGDFDMQVSKHTG